MVQIHTEYIKEVQGLIEVLWAITEVSSNLNIATDNIVTDKTWTIVNDKTWTIVNDKTWTIVNDEIQIIDNIKVQIQTEMTCLIIIIMDLKTDKTIMIKVIINQEMTCLIIIIMDLKTE